MNVFSSKENNGLQASCCNSSNDSSIAITKKLSYTSFPVKLFRLVTEERYSSLWWDGCGSHFAVNVPKFELEILRSESIPEEDRFKTITFTSFIRQLNLYGFRKVAVNKKHHVDPRDLQRYAHPMFLRGRADLLRRVQRPLVFPYGQGIRRTCMMDQMVSRSMNPEFGCKGIKLSRTGPKPKEIPRYGDKFIPIRKELPQRGKNKGIRSRRRSGKSCSRKQSTGPKNGLFMVYLLPINCHPQPLTVPWQSCGQAPFTHPTAIQFSGSPAVVACQNNCCILQPAHVNCSQPASMTLGSEVPMQSPAGFPTANPNQLVLVNSQTILPENQHAPTLVSSPQQVALQHASLQHFASQPVPTPLVQQAPVNKPANDQNILKDTTNLNKQESTATKDNNMADFEISITKQLESVLNEDVCMAMTSSHCATLEDFEQLKFWNEDLDQHADCNFLAEDHNIFNSDF